MILAPSQRLPPYQAPSLSPHFSELCLLPQRLKIKLSFGFFFHSISLVSASKNKLNLSESMRLVSCLHCVARAGPGLYLVERGCICKSLLPPVALLGSVFSCCCDKLTSQNIDVFQVQVSKVSRKQCFTLHLHELLFCCLKTSKTRVL